jgi:hypothetical protein
MDTESDPVDPDRLTAAYRLLEENSVNPSQHAPELVAAARHYLTIHASTGSGGTNK